MVIYKELDYVGSILLCVPGELFREADCSVHYTETRFIHYVDVRIESEEELDD